MIPSEILQKIDDETDIVSVVSEFVSLEKKGKNFMGLCPFHDEKTPSFSVSPEKNIAMCMGCGEGGRPINFYRKVKNISFQQAVFELAEKMGLELNLKYKEQVDPHEEKYKLMEEAAKFYSFNLFNSKSGEVALNYLKERSLEVETIRHFNLGYSSDSKDQLYEVLRDKGFNVSDMIDLGLVKQSGDGSYYDLFRNRLMFPITNPQGRVVGFSGRTMSKDDKVKYVNSPETEIFKKGNLLYHIYEAGPSIRRLKHVVLYEGFFDVISAYQAGLENGVATMGTSLTINHAKLIKKETNKAIIAFDGDKAGKKATLSAGDSLMREKLIVEVLNIPEKMDPDDYIKEFGPDKFDNLFLTNTLDPYAFEYYYHREGMDLTNANDINIFKENIVKMLSKTTGPIQELYKKRLATDLGIDVDSIVVPKYQEYQPYDPEVSLPPKKQKPRLINRYEQAERRLLFLMMRSKEWCEQIESELSIQDYAHMLNGTIRKKLNLYYEFNSNFDISKFMDELNEEEKEYMETHLFKDDFWIHQKKLSEKEIDEYIDLLKNSSKERRIKYLQEQIIIKLKDGKDVGSETEEYLNLILELNNKKEESNEF